MFKIETVFLKIIGIAIGLWITAFAINSWGARHPASFHRDVLTLKTPSPVFHSENEQQISTDLINAYNQIKAEEKPFDMSQIVTADMAGKDGDAVLAKMADKTFTLFWNSEAVQQNAVVSTATKLEKSIQQEVVVENQNTQHKFNLNVRAFQTTAELNYEGLTKAKVKYQISDSTLGFEVAEQVGQQKDIVLSHEVKSSDNNSQLAFRWNF